MSTQNSPSPSHNDLEDSYIQDALEASPTENGYQSLDEDSNMEDDTPVASPCGPEGSEKTAGGKTPKSQESRVRSRLSASPYLPPTTDKLPKDGKNDPLKNRIPKK